MTTDPTTNRYCHHADESFRSRMTDRHQTVLIIENVAGYRVTGEWGSLSQAKGIAKSSNDSLGLSDDDVLDIRASSMRASSVATGR